jgi:hypothetical protein
VYCYIDCNIDITKKNQTIDGNLTSTELLRVAWELVSGKRRRISNVIVRKRAKTSVGALFYTGAVHKKTKDQLVELDTVSV